MFKGRVILLCLIATLAVSAAITNEASANNTHLFSIEQTPLTAGSEAIVDQSQNTQTEELIGSVRIVKECQEDTSTGVIKPKGESTAEILYRNCFLFTKGAKGEKVFHPECEAVEPIKITAINNLIEHSIDQFEKFEGKITVKGEKCPFAAEFKIEGTQVCAIPESEFEKMIHHFICTPAASALFLNTGVEKLPAQYFGEEQIKLSSGKLWSAG